MPAIQWTGLPAALREHLFARVRERKITADDLYLLKLWRESDPEAPDGLWFKDFGSFKICGERKYPKTFLLRGQPARVLGVSGQRVFRAGMGFRNAAIFHRRSALLMALRGKCCHWRFRCRAALATNDAQRVHFGSYGRSPGSAISTGSGVGAASVDATANTCADGDGTA